MNIEINKLRKEYDKSFYTNEPLSKYSWFNLGGRAEFFFRPKNEIELTKFLKTLRGQKKIHILGAGSNTLIRDGGLDGVTIKLGSNFSNITLKDEGILEVGAATLDKNIANFAKENALTGLEFLSCIPGSIGGGIKMNSGCYGEDISGVLVSLKAIDIFGNIKEISKKDIVFHYRGSNLPEDLIILSVKLKGTTCEKNKIEKKQKEFVEKKKKSQPSQIKTCGSTFKNPKNKKAWSLIKDSGCDNLSVGEAKISEKHCNFFVNNGKATSYEIEELIKKVQNQVLKKTGINLELEIKVIGIK
tara:strand:+ start:225 stop:1127 length:903 start_codon:yes stop_codon:yes gene_type:complete